MSYQFEPAEFDRREELLGDRRGREEPSSQRLLTVAAVLAVMAVFAGGLWFAYYEGTRHAAGAAAGEVPLIRADQHPMMVRPAEPGGLKIPDRNMLIYDPGKRLVEHLLPPPEQPMARPAPAARVEAAPPPAALRSGAAPAQASNLTAPATPAATSSQGNAKRANEASGKAVAANKAAEAPHGAPAARRGAVRLQLGSVRNADAARLEWDHIRKKNADLLGALSARAVRADLGDKGTYYRIETGPVGDVAANRICGALKERKVGCIIVR